LAIEKVFEMSIISVDMKNLAVANALALNAHALEAIPPGESALKRVGRYARELPGVDRTVLLLPGGDSAPQGAEADAKELGFQIQILKGNSIGELLRTLQSLADGYDNLFYFFADCPLLDLSLSTRMLDSHGKYYADYTFADGYPYGLSPEILKPAVLAPLLALASKTESEGAEAGAFAAEAESIRAQDRGALFELIKKDINAFDIETELSPVDLRMLRAELCADRKRNLMLVERVVEAGAEDGQAVCRLLEERPEILRTLPAFFTVQIVAGCPQLCSYCPYPRFGIEETGMKGQMDLKVFAGLLDQIQAFCEDATLSVSLWGEPAYHSAFADLAAAVQAKRFRLIVETSGIGWQEGVFSRIAKKNLPGLDWIVSIDSRDAEEYRSLRGEGFEEAHRTVETLQSLFPGCVYPQAVRMNENEEGLENFYRYWKNQGGKVIVQKYDPFCGFLPDRRVTDLSPLKRFPCWHLKRDVAVLMDGSVCLCREDLKGEHVLGNIAKQSLEEIWAAGDRFYRDHLQERYPELCKKCDEYYSFNF
jgi:spiro-SPASM protein